ncbi:hypothetical protein SAMN05421788_11736 [Filimonas lacunae]|uniref:Uncharacterized protein n=1 Tax=Filimonas lacunae TaxID=477680 RepID=A0A173MEH9_9BACT|nr:hypothetical protein [Filimonas lacunae]BAV05889.1 hypothetical protein FLA_1901 [Filimonas lacunae]SIT34565.1 hypothetical protein SAMN05421788_11736 [Filimonas lacunae]
MENITTTNNIASAKVEVASQSEISIFDMPIQIELLEPRLELTTNKVYTGDTTVIRGV